MNKWVLICVLNGAYSREVFTTQEGAIKVRERKLQSRQITDHTSPTGYRTIWPMGWTAIRRLEDERYAV